MANDGRRRRFERDDSGFGLGHGSSWARTVSSVATRRQPTGPRGGQDARGTCTASAPPVIPNRSPGARGLPIPCAIASSYPARIRASTDAREKSEALDSSGDRLEVTTLR
jgi:hypothetical protein